MVAVYDRIILERTLKIYGTLADIKMGEGGKYSKY